MEIYETGSREPQLIEELVRIWEDSVRATHLFLSAAQIQQIKEYVPGALKKVEHLIAARTQPGRLVAFMGIENARLEMLFLSPGERGKGLGGQLLRYGIQNFHVRTLTVNEQNLQAVGFYEHMGFQTYKRADHDEQGGPYPLLYMKLAGL